MLDSYDRNVFNLIFSINFWTKNLLFTFSFILLLVIFAPLFLFAYPDFNAPITFVIFLLIYILGGLGVLRVIGLLNELNEETKLAENVINKGEKEVAMLFDEVVSTKIDNTTLKGFLDNKEALILKGINNNSAIKQLVFSIKNGALLDILESRSTLIEPYQNRIIRKIADIQAIQGNALRLGILGTFIGLIFAIVKVGESIPNSSATNNITTLIKERIENFAGLSQELVEALHIAFGTSIVGLGVSLFIAFLLALVIRPKQNIYFQSLISVVDIISMLFKGYYYRSKGLAGAMNQLKESLILTEERLEESVAHIDKKMDECVANIDKKLITTVNAISTSLATAISNLEKTNARIDAQTTTIQNGLKELTNLQKDWHNTMDDIQQDHQDLLLKLQEKSEKFIKTIHDEFEEVMRKEKEQCRDLKDRFLVFEQALVDGLNNYLTELKAVFDLLRLEKLNTDIKGAVKQAGDDLSVALKDNIKVIKAQLIDNSDGCRTFATTVENTSTTLTTSIENTNNTLKGLHLNESALASLSKKLENLEKSVTQFKSIVNIGYIIAALLALLFLVLLIK